jgi:uncharacterized RDD family membrane protein YckC
MKCPKCDYLGFETGDRCRNCGYDFSLIASPKVETPELALKPVAGRDTPIGELWLVPSDSTAGTSSDSDSASQIASFPLFAPGGDDEPLIGKPSEPRAPLSVRRAPDTSRVRSVSRSPGPVQNGLTLEFADEGSIHAMRAPGQEGISSGQEARSSALEAIVSTSSPVALPSPASAVASLGSRTLAAFLDHAILFGIDILVFLSTLRMTALTTDDWRGLPILPLLAFLLLLKLSYFAAFTAVGGQTIGKMAAGIRVVADAPLSMDPGRAITRTLTGAVSLGSLGLGLIPALISPDRRALHDRVARTHVVALPSA